MAPSHLPVVADAQVVSMLHSLICLGLPAAGLSIHTFHGNFFVRSTDLLSLPNVNPDAGYAVQMAVEESLTDMQVVSFQSALLYTSSKGEAGLRTACLCPGISHRSGGGNTTGNGLVNLSEE